MPYVTGYLNIVESGRPDQGLPGGGFNPVDPGFGGGRPGGADPGFGHPGWSTGRPGNELPTSPGHPSHGLPGSPGHPSGQPVPGGERPGNELPPPPPGIWPPPSPSNPIVPVPPPSGETKPIEPGTIWPPLAPGAKGQYLCLVIIPGVGYRYTVIDTSLSAGNELPSGGHPSGQPIPGNPPPLEHPSGQPVPPPGSTATPKK
jgi:splicing factor 1